MTETDCPFMAILLEEQMFSRGRPKSHLPVISPLQLFLGGNVSSFISADTYQIHFLVAKKMVPGIKEKSTCHSCVSNPTKKQRVE